MASGLIKLVDNQFLIPTDGRFSMKSLSTEPAGEDADCSKSELKSKLGKQIDKISDLQQKLYAAKRHSVLLIFQALDAAGKDSTIRHVLTGVNPAGCRVNPFGRPSEDDLAHDFLWRSTMALPKKGKIGVFNRSYYEEVLTVRVNPKFLLPQRVPGVTCKDDGTVVIANDFWEQRFDSIRDHELHLARQGVLVVKFFLNVSRDEQKKRLLARIDRPSKNWKFEAGDLDTREQWPAYMDAFEDMLGHTSRVCAPWYAIPADSKPFMRLKVAETIAAAMEKLSPEWPELGKPQMEGLQSAKARLEADD